MFTENMDNSNVEKLENVFNAFKNGNKEGLSIATLDGLLSDVEKATNAVDSDIKLKYIDERLDLLAGDLEPSVRSVYELRIGEGLNQLSQRHLSIAQREILQKMQSYFSEYLSR